MKVLVTQSCLTLCNPTDCSPPGSSVCGLLQARILKWVAISFSSGSSQPSSPALQADSILSEPLGKYYVYIVEYYSVIRKNEIMPFSGTLMN